MKGPQLAILIWFANLAVVAGGGAAGYFNYKDIQGDFKDSTTAALQKIEKPRLKLASWQATGRSGDLLDRNVFSMGNFSPHMRPPPPVPEPEPEPVPPPDPEPTDEELKAEVEAFINSQFELVTTLYAPALPSACKAIVLAREAGDARLILVNGFDFEKEYSGYKNDPDLLKLGKPEFGKIVSIENNFVLFDAPSQRPKYKHKRFEVQLKFDAELFGKPLKTFADFTSAGNPKDPAPRLPMPEVSPPDPRLNEKPKLTKSAYDEKKDLWTIGSEDYKFLDVDSFARYTKVIMGDDGKAIGIQISDEIPEDHIVVKRGGRRGDVIKSINGKPVRSMSDVRRVVRTDYNAGVEEFIVEYERDGLPGRKIFKVPHKKKTGK